MIYILLVLQFAFSDTIYDYYQDRSASQWTLSSWLLSKKKANLMDQWLSNHRANKKLFDFELGAGLREATTKHTTDSISYTETESNFYHLGMYYRFVGIEANYVKDKNTDKVYSADASLRIRLLGSSQQSTNWQIYYGQSNINSLTEEYENPIYGSKLTIYLTSFLGIYGDYQVIQGEKNTNDIFLSGDSIEYGGFLEVFFLRFYVRGHDTNYKRTLSNGDIEKDEEGTNEFGIMLFY